MTLKITDKLSEAAVVFIVNNKAVFIIILVMLIILAIIGSLSSCRVLVGAGLTETAWNVTAIVVLEGEREEIKMPNGGSFVVILEVVISIAETLMVREIWIMIDGWTVVSVNLKWIIDIIFFSKYSSC